MEYAQAKIMIRRFYHIRQELNFFFELFQYPVRNVLNYLFVNNRLRSAFGILLPYESTVGSNSLSEIIQLQPNCASQTESPMDNFLQVYFYTLYSMKHNEHCLLVFEVEVLPVYRVTAQILVVDRLYAK